MRSCEQYKECGLERAEICQELSDVVVVEILSAEILASNFDSVKR